MAKPNEERIYIGGLDPARLTVRETIERLQSSLLTVNDPNDVGAAFGIRDLHEGPSYVQFTAVPIHNNPSDGIPAQRTPLEAVAKLLHNVKWKGCKLKVQAARPHFLHRLTEEIRVRQIQQENQASLTADATIPPSASSTPVSPRPESTLPRHLKIRRGYGEESWKVDTKPVDVTNWRDFYKQTARLARKRNHVDPTVDAKKAVSASRKAHWNRAVRLRFDQSVAVPTRPPTVEVGRTHLQADKDVESDQESSSSESSRTSDQPHGSYVWSDDESSLDDENLDVRAHSEKESRTEQHPQSASKPLSANTYVWSSDDSSENSQSPPARIKSTTNSFNDVLHVMAVDEFAAGLDAQRTTSSDDGDNDIEINGDATDSFVPTAGTACADEDTTDLKDDIQSNLNVLASIFPSFRQVHQSHPVQETPTDNKPNKASTGWQSGQMLRYDPTKPSAQQFLMDKGTTGNDGQDQTEEDDSSNSTTKEDGNISADEKQQQPEIMGNPTTEGIATDVYEQGKLEQVFREARETDRTPIVVQTETEPGLSQERGFAFSFALANLPKAEVTPDPDPGFSFGFSVPNPSMAERGAGEKPTGSPHRLLVEESALQRENSVKRRHRGLTFPPEVIDEYVSRFYHMDDGARILQDPEGYRNDERVKEEWNKERKALTLDWKRKHKYAQSKKKNRMR